jgi:predicted nucleic acid-binding protein
VTGFLLDTNVLSEFARTGEPDQHVDRWLKTTVEESVFASVLTLAEIRRGIELLPPRQAADSIGTVAGRLGSVV